ncbi:hypothetical protein KVT40_002026 [Elsinoe batatas]|uniref:Uncharacterized protein n=1 Tax=Elsinoe batatas TaxID=2601811 RepID=A0A8K0PJD2_9PEZI|nr:hypothetical protein KVT40_002026 [Elsinoe batatas]
MSTSNSGDQGHGEMIHVSEIAIGIICALECELSAMTLMLDHHFKYLQGKPDSDENIYTPGRIGNLNVVIAGLPTGRYGQASAAAVATHMARTFVPNMKVALMVGIGGGIPSADHNVRLGDIVVGVPTDSCTGVIQVDLGKRLAGGNFKRTGSLDNPPAALLKALTTLRSAHRRSQVQFTSYIQEKTQSSQLQACWHRPSIDRLFSASSTHPQDKADCDDCVEHEIQRPPRNDLNPRVHYGIIATGNIVVKDAALREDLRKEYNASCIEMEAAGISESMPCLVIRGICDYADSHTNKEWQPYAALVAAAYSKELLRLLQPGDIQAARDDILQSNAAAMAAWSAEQAQRRAQAISRFNTTTYNEFKDGVAKRAPGTCEWVLSHEAFLKWKSTNTNSLLWISADPGCGKSVLAKALIEDQLLDAESDTLVCHFFFREDGGQNHLHEALCALLHQALLGLPDLADGVLSSLEERGDPVLKEPEVIARALHQLAQSSFRRNIVFVLDALDECFAEDCDRLIEILCYLAPSNSTRQVRQEAWCKLFATSRPYSNIERRFAELDNASTIRLKGEQENEAINEEIDHVIRARIVDIEKRRRLKQGDLDPVHDQLTSMRHRTYLWLQLMTKDIEMHLELNGNIDKLGLVPRSVNEAYSNILSKIPDIQRPRATIVLSVVLGAESPLSVWEMHAAIEVLEGRAKHVEDLDLSDDKLDILQADIRRWCNLFVFVQQQKIYFMHQTVRSFLLGELRGDNNSQLLGAEPLADQRRRPLPLPAWEANRGATTTISDSIVSRDTDCQTSWKPFFDLE